MGHPQNHVTGVRAQGLSIRRNFLGQNQIQDDRQERGGQDTRGQKDPRRRRHVLKRFRHELQTEPHA